MPFSRLYATQPQEITTILTLSPSSFANENIFRRAQFYKYKGEKDESNTILEAENQMDEWDITRKSRSDLADPSKPKPKPAMGKAPNQAHLHSRGPERHLEPAAQVSTNVGELGSENRETETSVPAQVSYLTYPHSPSSLYPISSFQVPEISECHHSFLYAIQTSTEVSCPRPYEGHFPSSRHEGYFGGN